MEETRPTASIRFDWLMVVTSAWLLGGTILDAWSHHVFELETFFTPWHAVLYSGFLANAAILGGTFARNLSQGHARRAALPAGYELALLGVAVFLAGGVGDGVWHTLFGIENNLEALISPTHLLLGLGAALIVSGPLRAARARAGAAGRELLPALFSLTFLLTVLTFFSAFANPFAELAALNENFPLGENQATANQALGVSAILLHAGILMGMVFFALRQWRLPFGSLTLVFGLNALLIVAPHGDYQLAPFAVLGGLLADLLYRRLQPAPERATAYRVFGFAVPVVFYSLYFAGLSVNGGVWWSVHLWTGAIVLAGAVGWLLAYTSAFIPPRAAED